MPSFQVTCCELVYVDRVYEIDAKDAADAEEKIRKSQGDAGELVYEQMQDTYSFDGVRRVHDADGNKAS